MSKPEKKKSEAAQAFRVRVILQAANSKSGRFRIAEKDFPKGERKSTLDLLKLAGWTWSKEKHPHKGTVYLFVIRRSN